MGFLRDILLMTYYSFSFQEDVDEPLFEDNFTTTESADLTSPRSAEDYGTWTITQADSGFDIVSEKLQIQHASNAAFTNNHLITQDTFTKQIGLALKQVVEWSSSSITVSIGFATDVDVTERVISAMYVNNVLGLSNSVTGATSTASLEFGTLSDVDTENQFVLVFLSSTLVGLFRRVSSSDWKLIGIYPVASADSTLTGYIASREVASPETFLINQFTVDQLTGNFAVENGIKTDELAGAITAGTTFTHEADFVTLATLTTRPSSGTLQIFFRIQDANNYWRFLVNSSGATQLHEIVAGTPTLRDGQASGLTGGELLQYRFVDEDITVFADTALILNYASAANFKTETSGEVEQLGTGGVINDLITYPYTQTASNASQLENL